MMACRDPGPNDMVPAILRQGSTVKEFEPEFFMVTMPHGEPPATTDFGIMKIYEYPKSRSDWKGYLNKYKGEAPERKYANFHLLLYIVDLLDIDTALAIAACVADGKPISKSLAELLEAS